MSFLANARGPFAVFALGFRRLALCLEISLLNSAPLPPVVLCVVELLEAAGLACPLGASCCSHTSPCIESKGLVTLHVRMVDDGGAGAAIRVR